MYEKQFLAQQHPNTSFSPPSFVALLTHDDDDAREGGGGGGAQIRPYSRERTGPVRVTQAGVFTSRTVHAAGVGCFALAGAAMCPAILHRGWPLALLLVSSCCAGYAYTGGPYPLVWSSVDRSVTRTITAPRPFHSKVPRLTNTDTVA